MNDTFLIPFYLENPNFTTGSKVKVTRPPTRLVEAEDGDLPADVDAQRANTEDAVVLQTILGVDGTGGDGGR